jgi:phospholipid/cholesterol/gamma-HCH transport system substrate-binding protein
MDVRRGVSIPHNSHIELASVGIMGDRTVTIASGKDAAVIAPGDTVSGVLLMDLSTVMGQVGGILNEVEETTKNLRDIVVAMNKDGKFREGVNDLAATSKSLRQMTEDNRERIDHTIASFDHSAAQLDQLLGDHYAQLDSSLSAIGRAGGKAELTVDNLAAISGDLKEITARLKAGQGSAGRLLNDDTLVRHLESTSASLDTLLKDLREHPGRYVKFSLF